MSTHVSGQMMIRILDGSILKNRNAVRALVATLANAADSTSNTLSDEEQGGQALTISVMTV
ncbi:hypothetical protein [Arthrobacter methylotrophus]|uniref:Uncharacterized protein n=1 Tax=Arthrobacter methylotrophus TaxID=121291 RepID=A0ABV5URK7_9MICC